MRPTDNADAADDGDYGQGQIDSTEPKLEPADLSDEEAKAVAAEFERMKQRRSCTE